MSAVIALLRAVNVGGRTVRAAQLVAVATGLGHGRVVTYANSGNLVLVPRGDQPPAVVAAELSEALARECGFDVPVLARSTAQWDALVAGVPFPAQAQADPARLVLVCFDGPVAAAAADLDPARWGDEQVVWAEHDAYAWYPSGQGRSKLTLDRLSRAAGRAGTARNWRTVLALAELAHERD